jgi:hypothetical protein
MSTAPTPPDGRQEDLTEFTRILYKARMDEWAANLRDIASASARGVATDWEQQKQSWRLDEAAMQAEYDLRKSIHDARLTISKEAIDRALKGAESVRNAAAAIGTIYAGIAGLIFAADATPLPPTGIVPAIFLGIAIVLSAAYSAWLGRSRGTAPPIPHSSLVEYQERRLNAFTDWAAAIVLTRVYTMHAAVLALGAGVGLLPLPFIATDPDYAWLIAAIAMVLVLGVPVLTARRRTERNPNQSAVSRQSSADAHAPANDVHAETSAGADVPQSDDGSVTRT